ncbi:uncharacterized protein Eint_061000 [Encephalitozoon intestinalis ATCC 50506]|uniref:Uncharacterized protein n=1 Tax=Encephalitozoon intestinalis (strain ATCC 50506) TaxID=876142 RepID=E0S7M8_ENCIT|nr:uncharacterized protein Eint_061000 [Encephalitozoon intestinalis ATCC 50506]ADM11707.1 hypothetical protein Eint_061000 [Encephalitozoon intestinalis ATCC 50506]UTX45444.1 hypothetical protein GPK93_06g09980 [Encephalitozoon intestinalis]
MEKIASINIKPFSSEVLTLFTLYFIVGIQYANVNWVLASWIIRILMLVNFLYQVRLLLRLISINRSDGKSALNDINIKTMMKLFCIAVLTIYFLRAIVAFKTGKAGIHKCAIFVSMGYLLPNACETLNSTTPYSASKTIFSSLTILIIGTALAVDFLNHGREGIPSEISYLVGVVLMAMESTIKRKVEERMERVPFRFEKFSLPITFLFLIVVSFPFLYPIAKRCIVLFFEWIIAIENEEHSSKKKGSSLSEEEAKILVLEYAKKIIPSIVKKILQEYIPNFKNIVREKIQEYVPQELGSTIKNKVQEYVPQALGSLSKASKSFYGWWTKPPREAPLSDEFD